MSVKPQDFVMKSKKEQVDTLRGMNLREINDLIKELKMFLYQLRVKKNLRALKQTHFISRVKRAVARAKTILKEKLLADPEKYKGQLKKKDLAK
jgi:ribosomal protein L29